MNLLKKRTWLHDLVELAYPRICSACERRLDYGEEILCLHCEMDLPTTNYHLDPENPVSKKFWGRLPLQNATALYTFFKGSKVQHLIHQLKYKGREDVGKKLGKILGQNLKGSNFLNGIDYIIPVPVHAKRRRERGYNQCHSIAKGLSEITEIPYIFDAMKRNFYSKTQTKKSVNDRFQNTKTLFSVTRPEIFKNYHILLLDDVLTTGSTLESCAQPILQIENTKISVATIAVAQLT